ncbi:hypothetical protein [uncultured Neptuniibacter sp.]|uniref:hypothetical protein n=1 Tax=uncultured Neptuniibacter sp. TaxID=502143 RepID=UPI00260C2E23|nr:hypothetical protein [uncultured Neptuniibacter sp.]
MDTPNEHEEMFAAIDYLKEKLKKERSLCESCDEKTSGCEEDEQLCQKIKLMTLAKKIQSN